MKFIGANSVRINKETVERAVTTWLNDGRYSDPLVVKRFVRHEDGSMTLHFEPKGQLSERQKQHIADAKAV